MCEVGVWKLVVRLSWVTDTVLQDWSDPSVTTGASHYGSHNEKKEKLLPPFVSEGGGDVVGVNWREAVYGYTTCIRDCCVC